MAHVLKASKLQTFDLKFTYWRLSLSLLTKRRFKGFLVWTSVFEALPVLSEMVLEGLGRV